MYVDTLKAVEIIDHYGENHQRYKAAEELSELQTVILQDANKDGKLSLDKIIEEIADVYVVLKQIELIYYIDDRDIQPIINYKIERTIERMESEKCSNE